MFSCFCSKKQPLREYYIEERDYKSEKILIDNNRLKLVCDGKIVVESDGFADSIKQARFCAIEDRRFVVAVLSREKLDEITRMKLETTEIMCVEIDGRKSAHKATIYVGTKSGKIEVYLFHVRNMKLARIYVFSLKKHVF